MLLARPLGGKIKYRIGGMESFFMLFVAVVADLLTLIPFVGMVLGWIFWLFFYMYLIFIRGIGLSASRLVTGGISSFAELLPVVQMLPTITLGVVRIILSTRVEDKEKSLSKKPSAQESSSSPTEQEGYPPETASSSVH